MIEAEKFSETIRLAMLSLLGFALACLLITLSAPDSSLLVAEPTIKMPFADVQVSFQSFLIVAPLLLIVITLYLHIFYGYWLNLETDYQHMMQSHGSSAPSIERLPTLFSLDHLVPRLLTTCIFYWLVPIVLLVMSWKAAARVEWGLPLALLTCVVTGALIFLQIRRRPAPQRRWWNLGNLLLWGVMVLIVGCLAGIAVLSIAQLSLRREMVVVPRWLPRPLDIFRADLQGEWLAAVALRDAHARYANFKDANLSGANLNGADLSEANLSGANLSGADLSDANLSGADLGEADLYGAYLGGADLSGAKLYGRADLSWANLYRANLYKADLSEANLSGANLSWANLYKADLSGAKLSWANLYRANLYATDLGGADLGEADLYGDNLSEADLGKTDLRGADLCGANVSQAQINQAIVDETTQLPNSTCSM
jgi:uncharacterized protein YjbI with pentapeptide repeats